MMIRPAVWRRLATAISVIALALASIGPQPAGAQSAPAGCAPITDSVVRLFSAFFLRAPDDSGRAYWTDRYVNGQLSLPGVATNFAASSEFHSTYGSLNDEQFVRLIYRNVLEREPDQGGLTFWTARLSQGASRGLVMTGFSESPEYVSKTRTSTPLSRTPFPLGTSYYCGSGDRVVPVAPPIGGSIIRSTMGGTSNNVIWARSGSLERGDLLVNEIGAYKGDHLIGYGSSSRVDVRHLEVESGGAWSFAIAPLSFAQPAGNSIAGRGDTVLRVDRGPGVVDLSHTGRSNFVIWAYTRSRSQLVANEIGTFQGQVVLDQAPGYLQVEADGDWSFRFS
ncbi:MAG: DUF4214 domain-containing protein [Acidimicrobiia bacterium]|nr:DUF4214 domain-containing protein [Acidimicrobiia bacterium]